MPKLVASAVVRDEADRYLDLWLRHLLEFVDEVRLLDDGSTDGTVEIATREGVRIKSNPGPTFLEMESDARNELLRYTMEAEPEYVISIDADEFVGDPGLVRYAIQRGFPVITLDMEEAWKVNEHNISVRVDGLWGARKCPIVWKAPRQLGGQWAIPDRKLACGREPLAVRRTKFKESGSSVFHFGWTREEERKKRAERYFEHDRGNFHQDRHLQSILWPDDKVVMKTKPWPPGLEMFRDELIGRTT